ncbi:MAG: TlpA family protein disulfide reductase [Acidimicrobiales bacterium]
MRVPRLPRWASPIRAGATLVGLVVIALIVVLATRPPATTVAARTPLIDKPAPAFSGSSLTGGGPVSLDGLRGRFVVVNFFASWCGPCQKEAPQLDAFAAQHRSKGGAVLVGVVFDDQTGVAARWVTQHGGHYPVVADPGGQLALHYGVRSPPTSFVIGPKGHILTKIVGQVTVAGLDHVMALARARGA